MIRQRNCYLLIFDHLSSSATCVIQSFQPPYSFPLDTEERVLIKNLFGIQIHATRSYINLQFGVLGDFKVNSVDHFIPKYLPPNSVASNALRIYLLQFFTILSGLLAGILIARLLGPAGKGTFDLFRTLSSFIIEIGALGLGYGCLFYLANQNAPLGKIHGSLLVFTFIAGVVAVLVGLAALPLWRLLFPGLQDWIIILAFLVSLFTIYLNIWLFVMLGINKAVDGHKLRLIFSTLTLLVTAALWALGILDIRALIWAAALIAILNSLVAFLYLLKKESKLAFDSQLMKQCLSYGSLIFIGVAANIVHFKIDQVMVNYFLGSASLGIYAVSVSWAERLFMLDAALLSSALYKISSSSSTESVTLTKKVFRAQSLISAVGALLLALIAYPLVIFLYGEAYRAAVIPLVLLLPGIFAWSIARVHSNMLVYNRGLGSYVVKITVIGCVINIILNIIGLGILHGNIIGVAIASSISYSFVAIFVYIKSRRISKETPVDPVMTG